MPKFKVNDIVRFDCDCSGCQTSLYKVIRIDIKHDKYIMAYIWNGILGTLDESIWRLDRNYVKA